jgi:aminoglycoside 3-N-acetyltransferase
MPSYRDFVSGLRGLNIDREQPVIVHASLSTFGEVPGGADSVLGALLASFDTLVMPAFTYKTMITPEVGPPNNAKIYGSARDANLMAEFFQPDVPVDDLMGAVAEALRRHPKSRRSDHPILSFCGVNADRVLEAQSLEEPLAPIGILKDSQGWVLLMGVDHTVNTSMHFAERLAGRKQFIRWALTPMGVVECPAFPGCSQGFDAIAASVESIARVAAVGSGEIRAFPLPDLIDIVSGWIEADPLALLCEREDCERCNAVRESVSQQ